ncbi:Peptide N-acetyl-beta-D-glucosaminyl asparaginase amidase A [Musa troglodytarum]|uniref:Peptide N-acetyl-beta-D-glucosaminyl asparaginase amidase A n=1 Tax=Musa troglodytarum TaxID=320322 RepID=A0A9E7H6Y1_9LILI|nr:Peptide N-acetyl-beta-D-glucosaminyl asparaginase amidase A [Musa troglodytarum]
MWRSKPTSLLLPLIFTSAICTHFSTLVSATPCPTESYHFAPRAPRTAEPQEFLDPTGPDFLLPQRPPSCSLPLLRHDFGDTYGRPPATAAYAPPPGCPAPWASVVLDLSVACAGEQYDRIAAVWLDGAELLRTSTAEPSESGVFWRVRKDITRYAALLRREEGGVASMMLENIVNDVFTGVYHVNVSLDFYMKEEEPTPEADISNGAKAKVPPLYREPADLIIPISSNDSQTGFWFRIQNESDVHFKRIQIPKNAYRAVLEIYVSYHSNDEFWYSNPPNSYIQQNNLTTERGNGSFREVYATIDRRFVGSIVPFPVIFTGGINPLFWEPVVALGAFDLPSYNLDLTPFLGLLLDGRPHDLGIGVTDGIAFWLVDANLHLWLDSRSSCVTAKLLRYQAPKISVSRHSISHRLNGTFTIEAGRKSYFSGWVNSSMGNLTTDVNFKLKFKSLVGFTGNGNRKEVQMKAKLKTGVQIKEGPKAVLAQGSYKFKYPLLIVSSTLPAENNTYRMTTNLSHILSEQTSVMFDRGRTYSSITDQQKADGWMLVQDHSVLAGSAATLQTYQYRDHTGFSYSRRVTAEDGLLLSDNTTLSSEASFH